MLVLTRKEGQAFTIDCGITLTVVAVEGNRVRLGVVAPPEVPVHRGEVHRRIREWHEPAGAADAPSGGRVTA